MPYRSVAGGCLNEPCGKGQERRDGQTVGQAAIASISTYLLRFYTVHRFIARPTRVSRHKGCLPSPISFRPVFHTTASQCALK